LRELTHAEKALKPCFQSGFLASVLAGLIFQSRLFSLQKLLGFCGA
jgi:hypothetical protein